MFSNASWHSDGGDAIFSQRLQRAAARILDGDQSVAAAQELEGVLIDEYIDEERTASLMEGLALYAPGQGAPYIGYLELCR